MNLRLFDSLHTSSGNPLCKKPIPSLTIWSFDQHTPKANEKMKCKKSQKCYFNRYYIPLQLCFENVNRTGSQFSQTNVIQEGDAIQVLLKNQDFELTRFFQKNPIRPTFRTLKNTVSEWHLEKKARLHLHLIESCTSCSAVASALIFG